MDDHYTFEDYPGFVALLRQLCKKKRSGLLQNGKISDVSFMHKRGSEALSLLTRVQAGRARFSEGVLSESNAQREPLPKCEDILDYFDNASAQVTAPPTAAGTGKCSATTLEPTDREVLEALMAEYIGPVAGVICEEHFASGVDLDSTVAALAAEIGDRERAERFVERVRGRLGPRL